METVTVVMHATEAMVIDVISPNANVVATPPEGLYGITNPSATSNPV
jgi:hypothetical protein